MIEHIQGTGLSGIATKNGKHGANSLFAKLLAMFEKHAQLNGKAQMLHQGKDGILTKGKVLTKDGARSVLSGKADALTAAKSKHLINLAMKSQHHVKNHTKAQQDGSDAMVLVSAHVLIDSVIHSKKPTHAGKSVVAGQIGKGQVLTKGEVSSKGEVLTKGEARLAQPDGGYIADLSGKPLTAKTDLDKTEIKLDKSAITKQRAAPDTKTMIAASKSGDPVSIGGLANTDQTRHAKQKVQAPTSGTGVKSDGVKLNHSSGTQVPLKQTEIMAQQTTATGRTETQASITADNVYRAYTGKTETQAAAEPVTAAVTTHLQKQLQLAQGQQQVTTSAAATASAAASTLVDTSLADSGSQSSDKGGQDGHFISALSSEIGQTNHPTSTATSFHQYLSGKATPSMTLFDSMNHIAQLASKGNTRLEIQLEPAHLGKIQVSLQSDAAKQLHVHMIVDQSATRQLIDQQLPALRHALAQQGLDLSGFTMSSHGEQSFSGFSGKHTAQTGAILPEIEPQSDNIGQALRPDTQSAMRYGGSVSIHI